MQDGKLQIGIIGCGGIANKKHMPALRKLSDKATMVAFCDIVLEKAQEAARRYGGKGAAVYTDYRELLSDSNIDVVHVLTPNTTHCNIVVDSFRANKHVMCEKPMAASTADAQKMLDAWRNTDRKFTIGYQNRFRDDVAAVNEACRCGDMGEVYFAKAHAVRRRAVPTWGVFMDKEKQGGGPLIDIGTHSLDMALWCMDNFKPKSVTGVTFHKMADAVEGNLFGAWDVEKFDVEDSAFGFIQMENGATIYLEASWILNIKESNEASMTLCGTKMGAEISHPMTDVPEVTFNFAKYGKLMIERPAAVAAVPYFGGAMLSPEDREAVQWLDCILNDTQPLVKPEQAFAVTQILEAIYTSAKTGKQVVF